MKCAIILYLSNFSKELFPHQLRDEGVVMQVLRILKRLTFGHEKLRIESILEFINWPFSVGVDNSLAEFKALGLGEKDLLLLCTRPPLGDERKKNRRKPDYHSNTILEVLFLLALRKYFVVCSRSNVGVQPNIINAFDPGYEDRSEVEFYSRRMREKKDGPIISDASYLNLLGLTGEVPAESYPPCLTPLMKAQKNLVKAEKNKSKAIDDMEKDKAGAKVARATSVLKKRMLRTSAGYIVFLPLSKSVNKEDLLQELALQAKLGYRKKLSEEENKQILELDFSALPGLLCVFSQSGTMSLLFSYCIGHFLKDKNYCDEGSENLFVKAFENLERGYFAMAEISFKNGIPVRTSSFEHCLKEMRWRMKFIASGPI